MSFFKTDILMNLMVLMKILLVGVEKIVNLLLDFYLIKAFLDD